MNVISVLTSFFPVTDNNCTYQTKKRKNLCRRMLSETTPDRLLDYGAGHSWQKTMRFAWSEDKLLALALFVLTNVHTCIFLYRLFLRQGPTEQAQRSNCFLDRRNKDGEIYVSIFMSA